MSEISRRAFLKGIPVALLAADYAQAYRLGEPDHPITSEVKTRLDALAFAITPSVTQGEMVHITVEGKKLQPNVNASAFASSLLYLAYCDGGYDEAQKVADLIQDRGLVVSSETTEIDEARTHWSTGPGDPITVVISTDSLVEYAKNGSHSTSDFTIWHELYHVTQQGRGDPETSDVGQALRLGVYLGVIPLATAIKIGKSLYEKVLSDEEMWEYKYDRRIILVNAILAAMGGVVSAPVGLFLGRMMGAFLEPLELQAYAQTNGALPWQFSGDQGALTTKEPFTSMRGTHFTFTPVQ